MKEFMRKKKKFIVGFIVLVTLCSVVATNFFTTTVEVEAKQNVFQTIQDEYIDDQELNILEITSADNMGELGYFIPNPNWTDYEITNGTDLVSNATLGERYGEDTSLNGTWPHNVDYKILLEMRKYGMIKYEGRDSVVDGVAENPIYTMNYATFARYTTWEYAPIPADVANADLVYGTYSMVTDGSGTYQLNPGYVLGDGTLQDDLYDAATKQPIAKLDAGYFYKVEDIQIETTSGNTIVVTNEKGYTKIAGGLGIPVAVTPGVTGGDVAFSYKENDTSGYYQGYSKSQFMYLIKRQAANGTFYSSNWLKEYVLGSVALNDVQVNYDVVKANEVSVGMIQDADLIYISGTHDAYINANQDLSADVVMALYNETTQNYKAIMMDRAVYSGSNVPKNNIDALALLTWQENQKVASILDPACFNDSGVMTALPSFTDETDASGTVVKEQIYSKLAAGILDGFNGNFAMHNIYVYDHHWQDFQNSLLQYEQVDAGENFANGDLKSAYNAAAATTGFSAVLSYIKINNNNTTIGHVAEGVVTPATVIQYILAYRGEDLGLIKSQYTVLEIQPTKEFLYNDYNETVAYGISTQRVQQNRDAFIEMVLGAEMTKNGRQEYVTFTSMTIDEFNTRQIDLLSTYDIIYIGDEWSKYYYQKTGKTYSLEQAKIVSDAKIPSQPENALMDGMIYYNIGDDKAITTTNAEDNKSQVREIRYSSRDLTEAKLKELKHFLDNDALIVVGKELMASTSDGNLKINPTEVLDKSIVDHGRVDTSSNLYELLAYGRGRTYDAANYSYTVSGASADIKTNLVSEWDLTRVSGARAAISKYLGRSKLSLEIHKAPSEYAYMTNNMGAAADAVYLQKESDNKYYLRYEFTIADSEVDGALGQLYAVHYYEDVNADGRFADTEEKTDISVSIIANGENPPSTTTDGVTTYNLNAGVAYELVRQVPADEGGIINWCIKVEKQTDKDIYALQTGYTAIKPMNRKVLNILQITDNDESSFNLEQISRDSDLGKFLYAPVVLEQYDIRIRTITVEQYERDLIAYSNSTAAGGFSTTDAKYLNYFSSFQRKEDEDPMAVNMLILGFGKSMEDFSATGSGAIRSYIDAGMPVLTSNSVIKEDSNTDLAGATGVDRYGYYSALYASLDKSKSYKSTEAGYVAYVPRREQYGNAIGYTVGGGRDSITPISQGLTNTIIRSRYIDSTTIPTYLNSETVRSFYRGANTFPKDYVYVDKMNDGQIAHFPYTIDEHTLICLSQAQDFQLDLDTDADNDRKSDAIAWFTLSALSDSSQSFSAARASSGDGTVNIYNETPGDGINNYYIYNYGNVTYMGLGGFGSSVTAGEAQLFVNTLIAAYEAGLADPIVNYYKTPDVNDGKLDSIPVVYDGNVTGNNAIDSSIQYDEETQRYLYMFVNPNTATGINTDIATKAYFKVTDSNFVKGEKIAEAVFYLGVNAEKGTAYTVQDGEWRYTTSVEEITLNDNSVVTVIQIPIDIYDATFEEKIGRSDKTTTSNGTNPQLKVGVMYGFYAPMSYLKEMGAAKIYIQANTGYKSINDLGEDVIKPLGTAYDMFTIIKQDLLKLD